MDRGVKNFDRTEREFQEVRKNLRNNQYEEALAHSQRTLELTEERTGADSIYTAGALNDIGMINLALGNYEAAEPAFRRSLEIREKRVNRNDPALAVSLNNLGVVCQHTGDYERAVDLYSRALAINEQNLGPDNFEALINMTNLAHALLLLGESDKAQAIARKASETADKLVGRNNPYLANAEDMLGRISLRQGNYEDAEIHFKTAVQILDRISAGGKNDPAAANSLENLAEVYLRRNQLAEAEKALQSARSALINALGNTHPALASINEKLALIRELTGDHQAAAQYLEAGLKSDDRVIDQAVGFSSEQKKLRFLARQRVRLDEYLSLVARHMIDDPTTVEKAFNAWLRRKGVVLESQRRFQEALVLSASPEVQAVFQELAVVRQQLSNLFFAPMDQGDRNAKLQMIADLEARKDHLESRLGQLSRAYTVNREMGRADAGQLQKRLATGRVLVEIARVRWTDFNHLAEGTPGGPGRYLAFVLPAQGKTVMVDLGPSEEIDRAVYSYKKSLMNSLSRSGEDVRVWSRKLYGLVFAPLKPVIGSSRYVFLSPDDLLNLLPFEVLQGPDNRFLIEDYTFNYLNVGRDLVRLDQSGPSTVSEAVLIGDPDFDLGDEKREAVVRRLGLSEQKSRSGSLNTQRMQGIQFEPLPGTRAEVGAIKDVLGSGRIEVFIGPEALEEVVRQKAGAGVIHLATHGFFLSDADLTDLAGNIFSETSSNGLLLKRSSPGNQTESPLLRSGLALAGANQTLRGQKTGQGDGLLTAEKVLGLNLGKTDMVVLSACETGVGQVRSGEGVFGLRRAFTQAGAKSMIMSLWSVPDQETKELMEEMYRQLRSEKVNRAEALRRAALKELKTVEDRYGNKNPLFWGAFVFLGVP